MGLANIVENWVLMGKTGPAAFRKVVASALAEFAKMAAFNALYYTAQGIVDIFFDPPRAAADFAGAAIWAGLAAGSALIGRAVAGDSFNQQGGGAAATSGTVNRSIAGNSSTGAGSDELKIIERSRYDQPPIGDLPIHRDIALMQQQMDKMQQHLGGVTNAIDRLANREQRIVFEGRLDEGVVFKIVGDKFDQLVHNNHQNSGRMYSYLKKGDV
jgi:hypothetical protein